MPEQVDEWSDFTGTWSGRAGIPVNKVKREWEVRQGSMNLARKGSRVMG